MTNLLKIIALIVISGAFLKATIDVDGSWDTWMYHLPYAARLWGISTPADYVMQYGLEERFRGFPVLAEYLQGLFWVITQRPESANLVSFSSLLLYILFLKRYLKIPFYLSTLLLLAIPLVQIHAVNSYIDLPANVAASILVILGYLLYARANFASRLNILLIVLAAASAVNMRFVLTPLAFIVVILVILRLWWLWERARKADIHTYRLVTILPILCLALAAIFATPLKNVIVHGNPAYPVRMSVAGVTLNYKEPAAEVVPPYLETAPRVQRWLYSIMDVGTYPFTHPLHWSIDQFVPPDFGNRLGGYFAAYVVFNSLLLLYLTYLLRTREVWAIFLTFSALTLLTANMPQSLELRYYLYWMIILVSLNAYLVMQLPPTSSARRWVNVTSLGSVAAGAMLIVILVTRGMYVSPSFYTFAELRKQHVDPQIIKTLHAEKGRTCLYRTPWTFLYAASLNMPVDYAIREGSAQTIEECGNYQLRPEWIVWGGGY